MNKPKIIFFGNGPLADTTISVLAKKCDIIFHAHTKDDLEEVKKLKTAHNATDNSDKIYGILASFGVLIKSDILELFEPEGILNIHPSMLPDLRGPSPIESAILRGDECFGVSVMKLVKEMDAGPIYYQKKCDKPLINQYSASPSDKSNIYNTLATIGAKWITENLNHLPTPKEQDSSKATFCQKMDKTMSVINPSTETSSEVLRKIIALSGWPKSKYEFFGHECIIHAAHSAAIHQQNNNPDKKSTNNFANEFDELSLKCADDKIVYIDSLQPAGKKVMDAKSFINGYRH